MPKLNVAAVLNGPPHITVFLLFLLVQVSKLPWIHILMKSPEVRIAIGCHCNNHKMEHVSDLTHTYIYIYIYHLLNIRYNTQKSWKR